jgi:UDP-3-O-[3-hydroxymyristoyl] glucosamine N-acyltransferase
VEKTLRELAEVLGCRLRGDPERVVRGVAGLDEAGPGDLSFYSNPAYRERVPLSRAGAVISAEEDFPEKVALLLTAKPQLAWAQALRLFHPEPKPVEFRGEGAVIHPTARLGAQVYVGPNAVIAAGAVIGDRVRLGAMAYVGENSCLGAETCLNPGVLVLHDVSIAERCTIHSGTVIGADGFGFVFHEGFHHKIPQVGRVEIGDDCEIGANCTIDRATTGVTRLGRNVIVDNLVQIAHNVQVVDGSILVAQSGISGSTVLGRFVTLAGQTGVAGHLTVGDGVIAAGRAGIDRDIAPGETVFGFPPVDHMTFKRQVAAVRRLPDLLKQVRRLERRLAALENPSESTDSADDS